MELHLRPAESADPSFPPVETQPLKSEQSQNGLPAPLTEQLTLLKKCRSSSLALAVTHQVGQLAELQAARILLLEGLMRSETETGRDARLALDLNQAEIAAVHRDLAPALAALLRQHGLRAHDGELLPLLPLDIESTENAVVQWAVDLIAAVESVLAEDPTGRVGKFPFGHKAYPRQLAAYIGVHYGAAEGAQPLARLLNCHNDSLTGYESRFSELYRRKDETGWLVHQHVREVLDRLGIQSEPPTSDEVSGEIVDQS